MKSMSPGMRRAATARRRTAAPDADSRIAGSCGGSASAASTAIPRRAPSASRRRRERSRRGPAMRSSPSSGIMRPKRAWWSQPQSSRSQAMSMPNFAAGGFDDANALRHHLLADAVAFDHGDPRSQPSAPRSAAGAPLSHPHDIVSITSGALPGFQGRIGFSRTARQRLATASAHVGMADEPRLRRRGAGESASTAACLLPHATST